MTNNITIIDALDAEQTVMTTQTANVHLPHQFAHLAVANSDVTNSNPVPTLAVAGNNVLGTTVPIMTFVTNAFTRPNNNTVYAQGQLVANSTTNTSVAAMTFSIARGNNLPCVIDRAEIMKSGNSIVNAQFRIHVYSNNPTVTNGDGATWLTNYANSYWGSLDCTMDKAFTDGATGTAIPTTGTQLELLPVVGGANVFVLVEARAAYLPANNEVFTVTLDVQNL